MALLILDSEALSALARPHQDELRHQRVRSALRTAHIRNHPVRVPSVVLVELYRGRGADEPVDLVLRWWASWPVVVAVASVCLFVWGGEPIGRI